MRWRRLGLRRLVMSKRKPGKRNMGRAKRRTLRFALKSAHLISRIGRGVHNRNYGDGPSRSNYGRCEEDGSEGIV